MEEVLHSEFDLYEQNFLSGDAEAIERYTDMLVKAGTSAGHYDMDTRKEYLEVIMGNKYSVSNSVVGVVGDDARNTTVTQTWNTFEKSVDYAKLANELRQLHEALDREASEPDQKLAASAVAAAEQSAERRDGKKLLEYLTIAGKWAFAVAEKSVSSWLKMHSRSPSMCETSHEKSQPGTSFRTRSARAAPRPRSARRAEWRRTPPPSRDPWSP